LERWRSSSGLTGRWLCSGWTLTLRPVITRREGAALVLDRTLKLLMTIHAGGASSQAVTYTDASAEKRKKGSNAVVCPVMVEQTRLVAILLIWTFTGVDQTRSGAASGDSGGTFYWWQELTVERGLDTGAVHPVVLCCVRSSLNAGAGIPDRWDWATEIECGGHMAGIQRPGTEWRASGRPELGCSVSPTALFR
jgi:hypothetical protein